MTNSFSLKLTVTPIFSAWILTLAIWCLTSQMWWEMLPAQRSKVWLSCPLRIALGLEWDIVPIHVPHSRAQGCKSKVVFDAKHLENQAKEKGELLWPRSLKMEVRRKDKIHCSSSHTAICLPGSLPIEKETLSVLGLGGGWWGRSPLCSTNSPPVLLVEWVPSFPQPKCRGELAQSRSLQFVVFVCFSIYCYLRQTLLCNPGWSGIHCVVLTSQLSSCLSPPHKC